MDVADEAQGEVEGSLDDAFATRPMSTWNTASLLELGGAEIAYPDRWHEPTLVLRDIFRVFWADALAQTRVILVEEDVDSRDRLAAVFALLHSRLTDESRPWGRCILLECRRYERDKIATCFMIPEFEDFLAELRTFVRRHQDAGIFMPINGDSLLEVLLSVVDGLAFASLIDTDFGYSSTINVEDVAAVTRLLVSGLLVSPLHQSRLYYDAVAQEYDDLYNDGISQAENGLVAARLKEICQGKRVLDLGCGSGLGYELLLDGCGSDFEYFGVDISSQMVRAARKRWPSVTNAQFHVMDAADLSYFGAEEFDCVISLFGSFSHVIDRDRAVSELRRVLVPGGELFLMLYSRFSLRNSWLNGRSATLKHYESLHPYEIRKTSGTIFADAWFYDRRAVNRVFQSFENVDIRGLNCLLELPLFAAPFESPRRTERAARYLRHESRLLCRVPNLCHSLLVSAQKA